MDETPNASPEAYLNAGALVWFVGFLVYYAQPAALPPRAAGYLYGVFALVGGVSIGVGLTRVEFPVPELTDGSL